MQNAGEAGAAGDHVARPRVHRPAIQRGQPEAPPPSGAGANVPPNSAPTAAHGKIDFTTDPNPPQKGSNVFRVKLTESSHQYMLRLRIVRSKDCAEIPASLFSTSAWKWGSAINSISPQSSETLWASRLPCIALNYSPHPADIEITSPVTRWERLLIARPREATHDGDRC